MKEKNTILISAFPGVGKSYLKENSSLSIKDSDSSKFDKSDFPANYIRHIKENMGKCDIILISSHDIVRKALVEEDLSFFLVYPDKSLKNEYIERYKQRGSDENFVKLLDEKWNEWINDMENQEGKCQKIVLSSDEYLSDIFN